MIDLWVLDDSGDEVPCPSCEVDIRVDILDETHKINRRKRWSSRVIVRCQYCNNVVSFDVSWIPEFLSGGEAV
jgi:hypothetical protein